MSIFHPLRRRFANRWCLMPGNIGKRVSGLACAAILGLSGPLAAQDPLSAIDWLDEQAGQPPDFGVLAPHSSLPPEEPPVSNGVSTPEVSVTPLDDAPRADAVGLLPGHVTGFPPTLWQSSDTSVITDLITAQNVDGQPAMQSLLFALLLAEALPPKEADGEFLLARIDRLFDLGAVAQAAELVALSDPTTNPALFQRAFDLALLADATDPACAALLAKPHLAPDLSSRIYCMARAGQWGDALTTLESGRALGDISAARYGLLLSFLDPEMAEDLPRLPPSARMTPLEYRLHEALGEPLPSASLPRAFANADLSGHSGWKAQIEAAERLVRAGALPEQRLFAYYTQGRPSASGGVWERAEAVQRFETALNARDPAEVGKSLRRVWPVMAQTGLKTAFAKTYAERLAALPLTGSAAAIRFEIAMLSPQYETLARELEPSGLTQSFAKALAAGTPGAAPAPSARARAIVDGFDGPTAPTLRVLLEDGKLGEVILRAISLTYSAHLGNDGALTVALATFRAVGLEDTARRAALQALFLTAEG